MPTIRLTQGQRARVDWCDYRELSKDNWQAKWSDYTKSFYVGRTVYSAGKYTHESMHRRILGLTPGDGLEVDHKDHDTLDNRRRNLRSVTRRGNAENQRNQSKYGPGVVNHNCVLKHPFRARAQIDGRQVHIGFYATAKDARAARERFLKTGQKKIGRRSDHGTGVSKDKRRLTRPFRVTAQLNGRFVHIGYFATAEEATKAREEFRKGGSHVC